MVCVWVVPGSALALVPQYTEYPETPEGPTSAGADQVKLGLETVFCQVLSTVPPVSIAVLGLLGAFLSTLNEGLPLLYCVQPETLSASSWTWPCHL